MEITRQSREALDLSSLEEVFSYTYAGEKKIEVTLRVDLGDSDQPIAGGETYTLNIELNGVSLIPSSQMEIGAGLTAAILQSRSFSINPGETVTVQILGAPSDTDINTITYLRDTTAGGAGLVPETATPVDHDFGYADALRVVDATGGPIGGAALVLYRVDDYTDGRRSSSYVQGTTTTSADGRWVSPVNLYSGQYTLVISKAGMQAILATVDTENNTVTYFQSVSSGDSNNQDDDPADVDHNFGSADALRITNSSGIPISGATLMLYLQSDYLAGRRASAYLRGRTTTRVDGRWEESVSLAAGVYVLVVSKLGNQPLTAEVEVL